MQAGQSVGVGVNLGEREFLFAERPHNVEHIQRPAARVGAAI